MVWWCYLMAFCNSVSEVNRCWWVVVRGWCIDYITGAVMRVCDTSYVTSAGAMKRVTPVT